MGKLKEKLLNNLTEQEMEDQFEMSSFEYVELLAKYKDEQSYRPTEDELENIETMIKDYYESKEFKEYMEHLELEDINDSMTLKYTDNDILYVLDGIAGPTLKGMLMAKLNDVWNTKNGVI